MDRLEIFFFNAPRVIFNGEQVVFPLKKCEALLYYLVLKGQATRDEAANLLWGNDEEETSKKNLRNALYKIKRAFDFEIIESPHKSILRMSGNIEIKSDIFDFILDNNENISAYTGEFLKGFHVKDCEEFEEWMLNQREYYKALHISKLSAFIKELIDKGDFSTGEALGVKLIGEDELDERNYRLLMELYIKSGAYNKGIEIYKKLEEVLDRELGITPEPKTREVLSKIEELKSAKYKESTRDNTHGEFFYGRKSEMEFLRSNFNEFLRGSRSISSLIVGEAGIGKSKLKDKFMYTISRDEVYIFETNCYQAEENFFLKPWYNIFSQLVEVLSSNNFKIPELWIESISAIFPVFAGIGENSRVNLTETQDKLKFKIAEEAIIGIFTKLTEIKKVVFVFEDIHWMDTLSLSLLTSVILRHGSNKIIFVATSREGYDKRLDRYFNPLLREDLINKIELKRFTREESIDFASKMLPSYPFSKEVNEIIYRETEGNTFFLVEYLKSFYTTGDEAVLYSKINDILNSRFSEVSNEGQKILNIASVFFDEVPIDLLIKISGRDEMEILDVLEELSERGILKEVDGKVQSFGFSHQKLREFIYGKLMPFKKKILHNRIGELIEEEIKNDKRDLFLYPRLIYHFNNGSNYIKALKYSIKNISQYLDFSHELFPVLLDSDEDKKGYVYLSREKTLNSFDEINKLIVRVKEVEESSSEISALETAYFHILGRYLIKEGEYEDGSRYIKEMIRISEDNGDYLYSLKGLKQMIYLCIQTHSVEEMSLYIDDALKYAEKLESEIEYWTIMRHKGLHKLMLCEYNEGEEILKKSIDYLQGAQSSKNNYSLNIAAAYNYIGDIKRYQHKQHEAIKFYEKAISICKTNSAVTSLAVFNTNIGQSYIELGEVSIAKEYFTKAIELYESLDYIWGYSIAASYLSLIFLREERYDKLRYYFGKAITNSMKIRNPYEMGLVYACMERIKVLMNSNLNLKHELSDLILEDENYYEKLAVENLKQITNIDYRETLKSIGSVV